MLQGPTQGQENSMSQDCNPGTATVRLRQAGGVANPAKRPPAPIQVIEPASPAIGPLSAEGQRSVADFVHVAANHNLALADRKAGILLTLVLAVMLFLLERYGLSPLGEWPATIALVWAVMMLLLATAAAAAFSVVVPRVIHQHDNLLFWADIGSHAGAARWIGRLKGHGEEALTAARLYHCHALARICVAKYRRLRVAMLTAASGLAAAALFLVL
jgi:hypothetical protein